MYTPKDAEDAARGLRENLTDEYTHVDSAMERAADILDTYAATLKAAQGGVTEAMVAELIAAGDFLAMNGTDGMVRRWERAKAALSAQPDSKVIGGDLKVKPGERVPEVDIKAAVSRFLGWLLPDDFAPDGGISYTPVPRHPDWTHDTRPTGTNLLHAGQAEAMLRYVLATPAAPAEEGDGKDGWVLVPVEATDDMLKAAYPLHWWDGPGQRLKQDYRKLVEAAQQAAR